ncbi:MAG: hypothetical protein GXP13_03385 [Gammaproteobacteria bacterium]|nr:hypothetical protein [Gammaproteobacteria bacterium]
MKNFILLVMLTFSFSVHALSYEQRLQKVIDLEEQCLQERTRLLKGLQQQKINECTNSDSSNKEDCEFYYSDYGWGSASGHGLRSPRFFDQIPICEKAFEAQENIDR